MRTTFAVLSALLLACVGEVGDDPFTADAQVTGDGQPTGSDGAATDGAIADAAPPDGDPLWQQLSSPEQELFLAINQERDSRGLATVVLRETLVCAARRHSDDIGEREWCTHTGSDGSSPGDRVEDCGGGGWSGEIVSCGYDTPGGAVTGWLNSPGHRAIMLAADQREIGVAMSNNYWTAIFDD